MTGVRGKAFIDKYSCLKENLTQLPTGTVISTSMMKIILEKCGYSSNKSERMALSEQLNRNKVIAFGGTDKCGHNIWMIS
jgi:hypothetical protein